MSKAPSVKVGDKFNTSEGYVVEVIEYHNSLDVVVRFEKGLEKSVRADHLKAGAIKNPLHSSVCGVGCYGVGSYKTRIECKKTKCYMTWMNMLLRCYSVKMSETQPTYKSCSVAEVWLNFQNFAEWYYQQPYANEPGFDLDKDLIILGNKEYSPETCSLVPHQINKLLIDHGSARGEWKQGVRYNKRDRKYESCVSMCDENRKYLGRYSTPEEAYIVYKAAKKKFVREQAEKYKDVLHPMVYFNLKNWELEEEL